MPVDKRDNRRDNLNVFDESNARFGWEQTPKAQYEMQKRLYNLDMLCLTLPLTLDRILPYPGYNGTTPIVDGVNVVDAMDQAGGTCVGASNTQATIGRHMMRDGAQELFDYMRYYCEVRKLLNDFKCNINAGATLPAAGNVLKKLGHAQIIGGKSQPFKVENGIESFVWGYSMESIFTAIANGIYPVVGLTVYKAMLTQKQIGGRWWHYWQDINASWGELLGLHAMVILGASTTIKLNSNSKGSVLMPNSWGGNWHPSWMSWEAGEKLLRSAYPMEIMLCTDRVLGPQGKLELADTFYLIPSNPPPGSKIKAHFSVKNTGAGILPQVKLAIEDKVTKDGVDTYGPGFGYEGPFALAPGETHTYEPERPEEVGEGLWRFRADDMSVTPTVMATVNVEVGDNPAPSPSASISQSPSASLSPSPSPEPSNEPTEIAIEVPPSVQLASGTTYLYMGMRDGRLIYQKGS